MAEQRQYPCYLYHAKKGEALVNNKAEEKALGPGYTAVPGGKPEPVDPAIAAKLVADQKAAADKKLAEEKAAADAKVAAAAKAPVPAAAPKPAVAPVKPVAPLEPKKP